MRPIISSVKSQIGTMGLSGQSQTARRENEAALSLLGTLRRLARCSDMSGVEVKSEVAGQPSSDAIDPEPTQKALPQTGGLD